MDRSELKREYKEAKKPMGVYSITDTKSGKIYIGCAVDVQARINRHKAELDFVGHRNKALQEAWDLSEGTGLMFEVLDVLEYEDLSEPPTTEDLESLLEMWVQKLEKSGKCVEKV